jgi:hypothetical protein
MAGLGLLALALAGLYLAAFRRRLM